MSAISKQKEIESMAASIKDRIMVLDYKSIMTENVLCGQQEILYRIMFVLAYYKV